MSVDDGPPQPGDDDGDSGGGGGLLRGGTRSRSYGSLVQSSSVSPPPVPPGLLEHRVQPGETLQGLALKYGVSMEQIKRANRLYTNDSIFLKKILFIPTPPSDSEAGRSLDLGEHVTCASAPNGDTADPSAAIQGWTGGDASELSPMDFLTRMDSSIRQSKKAAVQGFHDREKRFAAIEAACNMGTPEKSFLPRSQNGEQNQPMSLMAVPLTVTKTFRGMEDEIFQL